MTKLAGLIKQARVKVSSVDSEDLELHKSYLQKQGSTDKVVYAHRGTIFPEGKNNYIFWVDIKGYNFLYVYTPEKEEFLYYFPTKEEVIEPLGKVKDTFLYGIDITERKYCFELKVSITGEIYINYITTEPKGCGIGLKGLFQILYLLLSSINYTGVVTLKDDVQIAGKFITYERILEGKPSIYERYGFRILPERDEEIKKAKRSGDLKRLKELCSNMPMVAKDISKFV